MTLEQLSEIVDDMFAESPPQAFVYIDSDHPDGKFRAVLQTRGGRELTSEPPSDNALEALGRLAEMFGDGRRAT